MHSQIMGVILVVLLWKSVFVLMLHENRRLRITFCHSEDGGVYSRNPNKGRYFELDRFIQIDKFNLVLLIN